MPAAARAALAAALLAALAACGGDPTCGPGDAPAAGIAATVDGAALGFGDFTSSPNNDCTTGAVTSLTLEGFQVGEADDQTVVFCLPAPDQLDELPVPLTDTGRIQVIDLFATAAGCAVRLDRDRPLAGTATFTGLCDDGTAAAGYALALDAQLPVIEDCAGVQTDAALVLSGRTAVTAD